MNFADDSDHEDENYSHLDSTNIGSMNIGTNPTEIERREEQRRQSEAIEKAQLKLMEERMQNLKNYTTPIVVPTTPAQSASASSSVTSVASVASVAMTPVMASPAPYYSAANSGATNGGATNTQFQQSAPYVKPTPAIAEVEDPRFSIKQYTDKSIILRTGPSVPPTFFRDYAFCLNTPQMKGMFISNPKDQGPSGWCYSTYLFPKVEQTVRAIMGGQIAPQGHGAQAQAQQFQGQQNFQLQQPQQYPTMTSNTFAPQAPTAQPAPALQPTLPANRQIISIEILKPIVNAIIYLKIDNNSYPCVVRSVGTPEKNGLVTSAQADLQDGRRIEIKLINYKWQIPNFATPHEIV